ncbi:NAD(P)H-dependent flavin oxidoreductase [Halalkalibacter nanhaiisediminis]|uniref:Probable nitronate monooxygenase n=1 Tax=Halalkalibacter nanhaiisediminis TaxID=688079 RepID=A0A562QEE5_9BACI|nr:nitronate monooxygenase [Halalkalibacter nanhaiisediminis]TWI54550.1 nitronate monooxygenase [Halalkalibacter nanhaiisediminis]
MWKNEVTKLLNINYPILQAPMAGGVTTSKLVASVSNSGGLGMIGAGYMTPAQIREQIREIKQLTPNNFGINLFVPNEIHATESEINTAMDLMKPFYEELQIEEKQAKVSSTEAALVNFHEQVKVVIEENVPICSFTFGIPSKKVVVELKENNILLIGTATNVKEAIENENLGMDLVCVQGCEAGGHRGTFIGGFEESLIGLMSLIPQVADQINIPVIAAGGIMDGRGLSASMCLGAKAVQMGTAFLTCQESGAHHVHKEAILHTTEDEIVLTRAFSGKWARGIKNRFITEMKEHEDGLPNFPVQNTLTQQIRGAASSQNNQEFMSLWSGQSPTLAEHQTVEELISKTMSEAKAIMT